MVEWFNYYGLSLIVLIMLPNIAFAVKRKDEFGNEGIERAFIIIEAIGRYGCMALMIINIPYTYYAFFNAEYLAAVTIAYLSVNYALALAYVIIWIAMWKKSTLLRAVLLSCLPSTIFVFSANILLNAPLFVFACLFAVGHITVSVKNARADKLV